MLTVCGKQFPFSCLNANDMDRMEAAYTTYRTRANDVQKNMVHLSVGDRIRAQCRVVLDFIDAVLGEGASAQMGLDENHFDKALVCMKEMTDAIGTEGNSFRGMFGAQPISVPMNREQRRRQKKHKHTMTADELPRHTFGAEDYKPGSLNHNFNVYAAAQAADKARPSENYAVNTANDVKSAQAAVEALKNDPDAMRQLAEAARKIAAERHV